MATGPLNAGGELTSNPSGCQQPGSACAGVRLATTRTTSRRVARRSFRIMDDLDEEQPSTGTRA
jgi:hypothetical protein